MYMLYIMMCTCIYMCVFWFTRCGSRFLAISLPERGLEPVRQFVEENVYSYVPSHIAYIYIYIHVYIPMYIFLGECVTIRYSSRFLSISPPERSCNMLDKLVEEHVYLYVYSNIARKCAYTYHGMYTSCEYL